MFKTHKQIYNEIVSIILTKIIPSYSSSKTIFEIIMGLYMADDLIEYIGQDMLGDDNWNLMFLAGSEKSGKVDLDQWKTNSLQVFFLIQTIKEIY